MTAGARWIDLLDPSRGELDAHLPPRIHDRALARFLAPLEHADEPRPTLESHGEYVFGIFLVPVAIHEEDVVFYQEVDLVLTHELLLTVRKTPQHGRPPYDPRPALEGARDGDSAGALAYLLVDDVSERYLDLIDDLNEEIDELEDLVEDWRPEQVRDRLTELRHDILHVRRNLSPTRDAVREVIDNRVELAEDELFTRDVELNFATAYDKLLRATENIEFSRDLVAGVRDYYQAKVAQDQNEIVKRLTAIASLILVPTFIVGLYGQNFVHIPEFRWRLGYLWSWGLIVVATLVQIWYFRRKKWL